ncbi:MAG: efflux RND transporter periplasmic adaptor subunit [Cyanobacteriota bacterium]
MLLKKETQKILILSLLIFASTISLNACGINRLINNSKKETSSEVMLVKVSPVIEMNIKDQIEVSGILYPNEEVIVSNKITGKVLSINADLGDYVNKGKVIAQIDPLDYQYQTDELNARLNITKIKLEGVENKNKTLDDHTIVQQAKANMDDAYSRMLRLEELVEKKLVSQQDYDSSKAKYIAAKATYENAKINVASMKSELLANKAATNLSAHNVSETRITSPISGYIQKRSISLGEYLKAFTEMFTIVQTNPIKIRANIPERYAGVMNKGSKIKFSVDSYPDRTFNGTVNRVAPAIDTTSHTFEIEALVNNENNELKPGLFASINIDLGTTHIGMFVPESAIYSTVGLNKIFTLDGNKTKEHIVKLGSFSDNMIEIINEIKLNDKVIITDVDKLTDGIEVNVVSSKD